MTDPRPWWARGVKEIELDDGESEILFLLAWGGFARVSHDKEPATITIYFPRGARKTPIGQPDTPTTESDDLFSFFSLVHRGLIEYDRDTDIFWASHAAKRYAYALYRASEGNVPLFTATDSPSGASVPAVEKGAQAQAGATDFPVHPSQGKC